MRKGDIVVNPWVSKEYNGKLNPLYATIYIGENCSLDYMGRQHHWGHPIHKINEKEQTPWEIIGHIDLCEIIKREIGYEADAPQTDCAWMYDSRRDYEYDKALDEMERNFVEFEEFDDGEQETDTTDR